METESGNGKRKAEDGKDCHCNTYIQGMQGQDRSLSSKSAWSAWVGVKPGLWTGLMTFGHAPDKAINDDHDT